MNTRRCTKCKRDLPATLDYFCAEKRTKIGLQSQCRECLNSHGREYKILHRDRVIEAGKAYRSKNAGKEREKLKRWRRENPEKAKAQYRRFHEAHKSERNADSRDRTKRHYQLHPQTFYIAANIRRARKKASGGTFTLSEWERMKAKYGYTCLRCGRKEPEVTLTIDHIVPLVKGGKHSADNIQPLCRSCNCSKKANTVDYRNGSVQPLLVDPRILMTD